MITMEMKKSQDCTVKVPKRTFAMLKGIRKKTGMTMRKVVEISVDYWVNTKLKDSL